MNVDTIHEQLDAPVTRRRIVKTGVKLAYVAPIVAASFKLSGGPAGAVSTTACTGGNCRNAGFCETASGLCFCLQIPETGNPGFCHRCQKCNSAQDCGAGLPACPQGSVCSTATCCKRNGKLVPKCVQPCSNTLSDCVDPASGASVRVYDVAELSSDATSDGDCGQTVCSYL